MVQFARGEHDLQHNVARLKYKALRQDHLGTRRAADKLKLREAVRVRLRVIAEGMRVGYDMALDIVLVDK